ncbi:hypothetical protein QQ020_26070 [Fulvivirgaceae bacterium BMA12]|uniref:HTH cro/C1-type domain-containing protein n=1 Tax=Agaribacillus aureus TaxID=3051825 RepID=A0ABT8LGT7_9BACT|nr:hypothetical protein [Fulvivirgaceae bacterium BMA12]
MKKTKKMTTFEREMQDSKFKEAYDKEFREFALSELMLALMEDDKKSVRKLAEMAGLSPTAIQDLRSGKAKDVKFKNFISIIEAMGYGIELVKGKKRIPIHSSMSNQIDFSLL